MAATVAGNTFPPPVSTDRLPLAEVEKGAALHGSSAPTKSNAVVDSSYRSALFCGAGLVQRPRRSAAGTTFEDVGVAGICSALQGNISNASPNLSVSSPSPKPKDANTPTNTHNHATSGFAYPRKSGGHSASWGTHLTQRLPATAANDGGEPGSSTGENCTLRLTLEVQREGCQADNFERFLRAAAIVVDLAQINGIGSPQLHRVAGDNPTLGAIESKEAFMELSSPGGIGEIPTQVSSDVVGSAAAFSSNVRCPPSRLLCVDSRRMGTLIRRDENFTDICQGGGADAHYRGSEGRFYLPPASREPFAQLQASPLRST